MNKIRKYLIDGLLVLALLVSCSIEGVMDRRLDKAEKYFLEADKFQGLYETILSNELNSLQDSIERLKMTKTVPR